MTSRAFRNSKNTAVVISPLSFAHFHSSTTLSNAAMVEEFFEYANCSFVISPFSPAYDRSCSFANYSWILDTTGRKETSLLCLSSLFAPPLKIGVILAIFSLSGNTPDSKERFINGVSSLEQGPAVALRILADQDRYLAK